MDGGGGGGCCGGFFLFGVSIVQVSNVADTINIAGLKGEDIPALFHRLDQFQVTR